MNNYDRVRAAYHAHGYIFDDRQSVVNIFGIRSKDSQSDKFDDYVGFFVNVDGKPVYKIFKATTDPGKNWLLTPMRKDGCAIMVPGQYKSVYKVGHHKDYQALEQIGLIKYVRDNSKDSKLDFDLYRGPNRADNVFLDNLKTNIHRASKNKIVNFVGLYSAGCQVLQNVDDFTILLDYCKKQVSAGWPNSFTYTLLEETDLP